MNKANILIIDDEPQIRKLLSITLQGNGYKVMEAANGKMGISLASANSPDLILLDLWLPDISGFDVLQSIKIWFQKPVIILSVINQEEEIVKALDLGASDYLTKPFRSAELLARIRTALRNQIRSSSVIYQSGALTADIESRVVKKNDEILKLTVTEFNLLKLLITNEGRVLTHQYILKEVWGTGHQSETQYLRVFIGTLRKKIEENPNHPEHIITENGVGYRFQ
jgi:two-component system KDP operon response regulator KdpE